MYKLHVFTHKMFVWKALLCHSKTPAILNCITHSFLKVFRSFMKYRKILALGNLESIPDFSSGSCRNDIWHESPWGVKFCILIQKNRISDRVISADSSSQSCIKSCQWEITRFSTSLLLDPSHARVTENMSSKSVTVKCVRLETESFPHHLWEMQNWVQYP